MAAQHNRKKQSLGQRRQFRIDVYLSDMGRQYEMGYAEYEKETWRMGFFSALHFFYERA